MLGGGNPVGSGNPSGTSSSINYIGKHAYAYSGTVSVTDAATTMIDSTTAANSYIVGSVQLGCIVKVSDDFDLEIKINGETVYGMQFNNFNQDFLYGHEPINLLLAPNDRLQVLLTNVSSSTGRDCFATFNGEVYA